MRVVVYFAALMLTLSGEASSQEVVRIDLRSEHSIGKLENSGVDFTVLSDGAIRTISFENQVVRFDLLGNRSIQAKAALGFAKSIDNKLTTLRFYSYELNQAQILNCAKALLDQAGLSFPEFEKWLEIPSDGKFTEGFHWVDPNSYPVVSGQIKRVSHDQRMFSLEIHLHWNLRKHLSEDEESAARWVRTVSDDVSQVNLSRLTFQEDVEKDALAEVSEVKIPLDEVRKVESQDTPSSNLKSNASLSTVRWWRAAIPIVLVIFLIVLRVIFIKKKKNTQ